MEKTFMMVKPDGVQRGLIGEVVSRMERKGFKMLNAKLMHVDRALAQEHYSEHSERPFFGELVDFITSGPAFAMVWSGHNVIATTRLLMGSTNPAESAPGTIRGDLAVSVGMNIVHGSDSPASAERELALWFGDEEELTDYEKVVEKWI